MKRKMIKALEAAAENILTSGLKCSGNYVCVILEKMECDEADGAKEFFLRMCSFRNESFRYFDKYCGTFNGASEEACAYDYVVANQHRLMAIALAITLLRDRDFSLE